MRMDSAPVRVGSLFRQYRVIANVGGGGMGVVYRAQDTKLHRDVALKFIVHASGLSAKLGDRLRRAGFRFRDAERAVVLAVHDQDSGIFSNVGTAGSR